MPSSTIQHRLGRELAMLGLLATACSTIPAAHSSVTPAPAGAIPPMPRPSGTAASEAGATVPPPAAETASVPSRPAPTERLARSGVQPGEIVSIAWRLSPTGHGGRAALTLPNGEVFSGSFYEVERLPEAAEPWITPDVRREVGWSGTSTDPSEPTFGVYPSGAVVATLHGDRGTVLRCHLHQRRPLGHFLARVRGSCESSTGESIPVRFTP